MTRKLWPVEVKIDENGFIRISQEVGTFEEDASILLHPDQIDLLVQWLNDARDELQKQ